MEGEQDRNLYINYPPWKQEDFLQTININYPRLSLSMEAGRRRILFILIYNYTPGPFASPPWKRQVDRTRLAQHTIAPGRPIQGRVFRVLNILFQRPHIYACPPR